MSSIQAMLTLNVLKVADAAAIVKATMAANKRGASRKSARSS